MFQNKSISGMKDRTRSQLTSSRHLQLQQLQHEIDKLALLVNEAKRQSDKIQAAADALGDAVFADLEAAIVSPPGPEKRIRSRKMEN